MEVDDAGWPDIDDRLAGSKHDSSALEPVIVYLADRLVSHFGVDVVECHIGKNDPRRHAINEVAAAAIAHLVPVLEAIPDGTLEDLAEQGVLARTPPPWDDSWRENPRTASWRS